MLGICIMLRDPFRETIAEHNGHHPDQGNLKVCMGTPEEVLNMRKVVERKAARHVRGRRHEDQFGLSTRMK